MIEAAEQCERTALPELGDTVPLDRLLKDWPQDRALIFADEEGGAPFMQAVAGADKAAILSGPEGGFDPVERSRILAVPQVVRVSLWATVLPAHSAAAAAGSRLKAENGEWPTVRLNYDRSDRAQIATGGNKVEQGG